VPALVIVDVAVVAMVLLVAEAPAVIWHKDERVQQVTHGIVELQMQAAEISMRMTKHER
jgi:hypothetical protein